MIKKILIVFSLCVCGVSFSFAQTSKNVAEENMVDVSLEGLKNSYQKLADQNRLLASGIEGYRGHIQSLQQELDFLESQKTKLLATHEAGENTGAMSPESASRQAIEQLTDKINSTSEKAIEKKFQQKKGELDRALEQGRRTLRAARSNLDKSKKVLDRAATEIVQLKARQAQLQQQLADRQPGIDPPSVKAYAHQMDQEIAQLRSRQSELERKLSHAANDEPVDISKFTEESYRLRRAFVTLSDENMRLKREVFRLGIIAGSSQQ